jgi:hypothetical protein
MSSFTHPHRFYLFRMKTGLRKIAYGCSPEEAYENLKLRLTEKEMDLIVSSDYQKISQLEFQQYVRELG